MLSRRSVLLAPTLLGACAWPGPALREGQQAQSLVLPGQEAALSMWLYLPPGYHASASSWPLVVFLHGSGERGEDLDRVKVHGPPMHVAQGAHYPFILCSPQLPAGRWSPTLLHAMLPALQSRLRIDRERISATGLSLGGHGVWDWAAAYPRDLAAIAPVCGYGDPAAVCRGRQVPVRAYHGDADAVVPLARQRACIDALRACGGSADFTVYPGVGHDAWTPAYRDTGLAPWLVAQRRATPA